MSFRIAERVYTGNSIESAQTIGTVNFRSDGSLEIINIQGVALKIGDIIYGEDSGYSFSINSLIENRVGAGIPWDTQNYVVQDDGAFVALDEFFTGTDSQNYQKDLLVEIQ